MTPSSPPAVLLVNAFHRDTTGADRYTRDLAKLLAEHGHRVAPFSARHAINDDAGEWARFFPEGADTAPDARPGLARRVRDAGKFFYHFEARRRAREIADTFRPDLVHAQNLFHHLSPSVLGALRATGVPIVMTLHDYKLVCPNYTLYTQGHPCTACFGGRFWHAVARRCVRDSALFSAVCATENALHWNLGLYERKVDLWIAPSRFLVRRFIEFGYPERKFRVVPNFTELPAPSEEGEGDYVLFAGRLVAVKGASVLLDAWKRTRARRSLRLLVVGDGPTRAECERIAADGGLREVEFLGQVDRDAVARLMARAVLVIIPSLWYEVFPLVALEAQAAGRPVIASSIGGLPEAIEHEQTGLLVPAGSAPALGAAIDELVDSPSRRRRMGDAGRQRVATEFSPQRHYERLREIYDEAFAIRG